MVKAITSLKNYEPALMLGIPMHLDDLDPTGASEGDLVTFIGGEWTYSAGLFAIINTTSIMSVGIGAGTGSTGVSDAVFIGSNAGDNAPFADDAIFIGTDAGSGATNANNSFFMGTGAGAGATDANESVFFGIQAGYAALNAKRSMFIGYQSGYLATDSTRSQFIGYQSGYEAFTANDSLFQGNRAGYQATYAAQSIFTGYEAGLGAVNAKNTIALGYRAGYNDTVDNTLSGTSILIGNNTSTGGFSDSIAIGTSSTNTKTNQLYLADSITSYVMKGIPAFADDTAAGLGGLMTGELYQTTGSGSAPLNTPGILMIKQ